MALTAIKPDRGGRKRPDKEASSGFSLIEALVAMAVFAIGAMMVVPTMFAWVRTNTLSLQQDVATRNLAAQGHGLRQQAWTDWATPESVASYVSAVAKSEDCVDKFLNGSSVNCTTGSLSFPAFMASDVAPAQSPNGGYAITAVTQSASTLSRVMVLKIRWTGPAGNTQEAARIVQRPSPTL